MKLLILVCAALIASVYSHSWMDVPLGGYEQLGIPSANETSPCGFDGNYLAPVIISSGNFFTVEWPTNDHTGGQVTLRLLEANTKNLVAPVATFPTIENANNDPRTSVRVRIPFNVPSGEYLLQWEWETFFTCARVDVQAFPFNVSLVVTDGVAVLGQATPDLTYYNINPSSNEQGILVTVNGPTGASFISAYLGGREIGFPTANNFTEKYDTSVASPLVFGICNDGTLNDNFVGIQGSPATSGEPISVTAIVFENLVNVGTVLNSGAHQGFRFYLTQAFETFGEPRRIVVRANEPITTAPYDFKLATDDCTFTQGVVTGGLVGVQTGCLQLPKGDKPEDKYIQVPPMNVAYSITAENGLCAEISASVSMEASIAAIFVALLFLLL